MAVPWLAILDTVLGMTDVARRLRRRALPDDDQLSVSPQGGGPLEARLAGVVVAALKEAFDRDHERLQIERDHIEAERQRAERALRLELARQAGERELSRMRLLTTIGAGTWLVTAFLSAPLVDWSIAARVVLGAGWLLILIGITVSFTAQTRIARVLDRVAKQGGSGSAVEEVVAGPAGTAATWLIVLGLATVAAALLL